MGHWYFIEPANLSKRDGKHEWIFAAYSEAPSEASDGQWHHALHFRNRDRTCFGRKTFDGLVHHDIVRRKAARIVQDEEFRASLLSHDPELPVLWKRR
jgi:hypothetical protein